MCICPYCGKEKKGIVPGKYECSNCFTRFELLNNGTIQVERLTGQRKQSIYGFPLFDFVLYLVIPSLYIFKDLSRQGLDLFIGVSITVIIIPLVIAVWDVLWDRKVKKNTLELLFAAMTSKKKRYTYKDQLRGKVALYTEMVAIAMLIMCVLIKAII